MQLKSCQPASKIGHCLSEHIVYSDCCKWFTFTTLAGTTTDIPAVTVTILSVVLLVVSLIMGLKFRWFRARIYNIHGSKDKDSSEPTSFTGVYRGQSFEAASIAPQVRRLDNATAGSSSHNFQPPSSSRQLPPPSSGQQVKTEYRKNYSAPSYGNPPVGQSQPLGSKQDNVRGNVSKYQPTTNRNPLAQLDRGNEHWRVEKPPQSMGQNMRPRNEVPVPKSDLQKTKLPPIPVSNDDNPTQSKLTNDNHTSPTEIHQNYVPLRPGDGGPMAPKRKAPKPPKVRDQDESETET
jgi:uncharacterized membrane protein YtjA (UPF0391 family)